MAHDRAIGGGLLGGSVVVIIVYLVLVWGGLGDVVSLIVLRLTATIAVVAVFAILAWIGYTMATTPPAVPLEAETATQTPPTTGGSSSSSPSEGMSMGQSSPESRETRAAGASSEGN